MAIYIAMTIFSTVGGWFLVIQLFLSMQEKQSIEYLWLSLIISYLFAITGIVVKYAMNSRTHKRYAKRSKEITE